jgi:hypothetical protein
MPFGEHFRARLLGGEVGFGHPGACKSGDWLMVDRARSMNGWREMTSKITHAKNPPTGNFKAGNLKKSTNFHIF